MRIAMFIRIHGSQPALEAGAGVWMRWPAVRDDCCDLFVQGIVALSDYTLTDRTPGLAEAVHTRRRGEIERIAAGAGHRWTNVSSKRCQVVAVSFRQECRRAQVACTS